MRRLLLFTCRVRRRDNATRRSWRGMNAVQEDLSLILCILSSVRDLCLATDHGGGGGGGSTSSSGSSSHREAYVRLSIAPEVDQRRRQSGRCIRLGVDSSASFDERFKFPVSHDQLSEKTLRFQVRIDAARTTLRRTLRSSRARARISARGSRLSDEPSRNRLVLESERQVREKRIRRA